MDPDEMRRYFISLGSARLEAGKTITWAWADYDAELYVKVENVTKDRYISFR